MSRRSSGAIAAAAQLACLLEAHAPKPGNVSPGRPFGDMRYADFLASAAAIGEPLAAAPTQRLGVTIRRAVEATRTWTTANTNLGLVLLLAPLVHAALDADPAEPVADDHEALRGALARVLSATTVADAADVYAAIRLAAPGGLGRADAEDVHGEPMHSLVEVMRLAATRDGIAREYATAYETTFQVGVPALARARGDGLSWDEAIVETFLTLLAHAPDTHIVRRGGMALASRVAGDARAAQALGGVRTGDGRRALEALDGSLRDPRNTANPGTTADLTAAAVFVALVGEVDRRGRE